MSAARWEIRRTEAGYHVVFVAANGEPVVVGEALKNWTDARHAIEVVTFADAEIISVDQRTHIPPDVDRRQVSTSKEQANDR